MTKSEDVTTVGGTTRSSASATLSANPLFGGMEPQSKSERRPSDWKKILLIGGLGVLSWISTYTGMLELIEANMGALDITIQVAIGLSVAMLMLMIIWLLDQLFSPIHWTTRSLFFAGYVFLTLISVGFSFGFYWKFLNSRTEASRSAESAVSQVQNSLLGAETRLSQLQATLITLTGISTQKAENERATGNSCPNSRPGDGPRRRLREADAAQFALSSKFVGTRVDELKASIAALDGDLQLVVKGDPSTIDAKSGTRNDFMRELSRKLDRAVTSFNAFRTDPQLRQFRTTFQARAEKVTFADDSGGQFSCPDPQLQAALRSAVVAIDEMPVLEKPEIAAVEGAEATIEAFRRLLVTSAGLMQLKMPPSAEELRERQQKAIQSMQQGAARPQAIEQAGLGKNDWIPLLIAVFVDFCLLLVSISRPMNRFTALTDRMHQAQDWPVIEILSKFHGIHQDPAIRQTFEVLRHVVLDWRGVYYAAIPLNGGDGADGAPTSKEQELEAYLLNNLFTSFERERIFKPVPVSMFTTAYIQKKLRQQRSKYANVEAFRIYKFNNGAWPEMILGAIMGAAKRVEAHERMMLKEEQERQRELRRSGLVELPASNAAAADEDADEVGSVQQTPTRNAVPSKTKKTNGTLALAVDAKPDGRNHKIEPTFDNGASAVSGSDSMANGRPVSGDDLTQILAHMTTLIEKLSTERATSASREAAAVPPVSVPEVDASHASAAPADTAANDKNSSITIDLAALVERASKIGERDEGGAVEDKSLGGFASERRRVYHSVPFGDEPGRAAATAAEVVPSAKEAGAISRIRGSLAKVLSLPKRNIEAGDLPSDAAGEAFAKVSGSEQPPEVAAIAAALISSDRSANKEPSLASRLAMADASINAALEPTFEADATVSSPREIERFIEAAQDLPKVLEAEDRPAAFGRSLSVYDDLPVVDLEPAAADGVERPNGRDEPAAKNEASSGRTSNPNDPDDALTDWEQPEIDFTSITKWYGRGRDKGVGNA